MKHRMGTRCMDDSSALETRRCSCVRTSIRQRIGIPDLRRVAVHAAFHDLDLELLDAALGLVRRIGRLRTGTLRKPRLLSGLEECFRARLRSRASPSLERAREPQRVSHEGTSAETGSSNFSFAVASSQASVTRSINLHRTPAQIASSLPLMHLSRDFFLDCHTLRVDNPYGDRNLVGACEPMSSYS